MRTQELLPFSGDRSTGRLPLFCLPHAGGGASAYRGLARDLRPELNLQPVQLPGREGLASLSLRDDVPALVELLGSTLEPLLDKPFGLFGHSMGALLAAELTAWLERRGGPLPRLLVVSSYSGDFRHNRVAHLDQTDDELAAELASLGGTSPEVLENAEMREIVLEIMRNDMRLVRSYRPTYDTLSVPILALGGNQDPEVPVDGLEAWRLRTTASCAVHVLPGGHFATHEHPRVVAGHVTAALVSPEDVLLDILRTRLDDQDITVEDDFYAAGGDSVVALGVLADARQRGYELSLRDLLTSASIGELVPLLTPIVAEPDVEGLPFEGLDPADRVFVPAGLLDAYPASSLQVGLIYLCELADDPSLYNDLTGMRVLAKFDAVKFRSALSRLMNRHPALRSSFDLATFSTAVHLIWPDVEPPVDLEHGTEDTADGLVLAWRERHLATGIDWSTAPAFRCHVVALPGEFRLTVAIHHAIIDGWSFARLLVELLTFYDAELTGRAAVLPPVPADGYRRFVALEQAATKSPEAAAFWRAEADVPPLLLQERPIDAPDPTEIRHLPLDTPTLDRLRSTAERIGVPLKSLFLSLHGWALAQATRRDEDVVTGLIVNGRPEIAGADHLVGLFLNTVPLRLRSTGGSWAEQARRAWEAERLLLAHRRFPLSEIEQGLGRSAFDVSFNFTHFHSYRELAGLRLEADSWWAYDKASFPMMADFMIDSVELGSAVVVAFDPALIDPALAEVYVSSLEFALSSAAESPAHVPLQPAGA
jgi:surfactin synthase thioesterase subunit/aryl carrier-like protein